MDLHQISTYASNHWHALHQSGMYHTLRISKVFTVVDIKLLLQMFCYALHTIDFLFRLELHHN